MDLTSSRPPARPRGGVTALSVPQGRGLSRWTGLTLVLALSTTLAKAQAPLPTPEKTYEVVVETHRVAVRDGTKLAVDVYRPARNGAALAGRFPTLLTRTPYDKKRAAAECRWFAERGYVVAANDTRGRFASEGRWRMMVDDPNDGQDILEWLAAQPWSQGKVGTFGTSYVGGTQHALACNNPRGLAAMIPVDALSNAGIAGMRHSGAFELRFFNWIFLHGASSREAAAHPALQAALKEVATNVPQYLQNLPLRKGTTPLKHLPDYEDWLVFALRHGDNDAYWKQPGLSVLANVDRYADVPIYHVTGWYDSWCRQNILNWQALSQAKKSPQFLIVGPWTHGAQSSPFAGEIAFPPEAALDFNTWRKRWFDRWVAGVDNGVEKEPAVKLFVMGGGSGRKDANGRLQHGGSWRQANQFPLPATRFTPYYLHADGTLSPQKPAPPAPHATTYRFDPTDPVPSLGGNISSFAGFLEPGGFDQRLRKDTLFARNQIPLALRRDVLVFQTVPLSEDLEIIGPIEVKLYVSSTAVDTDFTAKLIDVYPPNEDFPLGFDLNLGDSILRMRYRNSLEKAELMTPGEVYEATIHLYPTANRFARGHRIRLDISSSNFPRFDINPNTGEPLQEHRRMIPADNTVYHSAERPSHVLLPVIPAP